MKRFFNLLVFLLICSCLRSNAAAFEAGDEVYKIYLKTCVHYEQRGFVKISHKQAHEKDHVSLSVDFHNPSVEIMPNCWSGSSQSSITRDIPIEEFENFLKALESMDSMRAKEIKIYILMHDLAKSG